MIKYLIHRPVSVLMVFSVLFILGIILYMNIPVTLLPNIAIPRLLCRYQGKTRLLEIENTVVRLC